jgi:hypothetical protein
MVESRDMEIRRDQERVRKVPPMLGGGGCKTHIIAPLFPRTFCSYCVSVRFVFLLFRG